ncbi:uncharacterized protein LOC125532815 [Triticum urartu]|uniref:uncharacterized protein LOC125532815 n=1 Tax=Triticum urartu TaxID=4572 RepID=UPI0020433D28|nr:uncharacterized protein LOC125532815 [Triticum urartu]
MDANLADCKIEKKERPPPGRALIHSSPRPALDPLPSPERSHRHGLAVRVATGRRPSFARVRELPHSRLRRLRPLPRARSPYVVGIDFVFNLRPPQRHRRFHHCLPLLSCQRATLELLDSETAADAPMIGYVDDDPPPCQSNQMTDPMSQTTPLMTTTTRRMPTTT